MNLTKKLTELTALQVKLRREIKELRACEQLERRTKALSRTKLKQQRKLERWQQVEALHNSGRTFVSIAKELNLSAQRVRQLYQGAIFARGHASKIAERVTLETSVFDLGFSVRVHNTLNNADINTVGDLVEFTENRLRKYRNMGTISVEEIRETLTRHGFNLAPGLEY